MGLVEILLAFLTSFAATLAWAARGLVMWPLRFVRRQASRAIVWFIGPELRRHRGAESRVSIPSDRVSSRNQTSVVAGIHPVPQCPASSAWNLSGRKYNSHAFVAPTSLGTLILQLLRDHRCRLRPGEPLGPELPFRTL